MFFKEMDYIVNVTEMILAYILTLGMTSATAILGGWMLKDFVLKKKLCTKEVEAKVIGYKEETHNGDDGNRISYYYKYKYFINNIPFEDISSIGEASPVFAVGSKIILKYNPQNHSQHYIVGSSFPLTMVLGGILFVLIGVVCFIFTCMGIYQRMNSL